MLMGQPSCEFAESSLACLNFQLRKLIYIFVQGHGSADTFARDSGIGTRDCLGPVCFCVSKALLIKFEIFLFFY